MLAAAAPLAFTPRMTRPDGRQPVQLRPTSFILNLALGLTLSLATPLTAIEIQNNPDGKARESAWVTVAVSEGSLAGKLQFRVEDFGDGMKLDQWELGNPPDWLAGFKAAKGMNHLTFDQFKHSVSARFLKETGMDEARFAEMTKGSTRHEPDYSIFRVIYLKCGAGNFALVSCCNNKDASLAGKTKRLEADGKTKYLGSWIHLQKDGARFVLVSPAELSTAGVTFFPYANPEMLKSLMERKQLTWNKVQKEYGTP